jgi:hypothetical protein
MTVTVRNSNKRGMWLIVSTTTTVFIHLPFLSRLRDENRNHPCEDTIRHYHSRKWQQNDVQRAAAP